MGPKTVALAFLVTALASGCGGTPVVHLRVGEQPSILSGERDRPTELRVSIEGPDQPLELVVHDPVLIGRLCLGPLAAAKGAGEEANHKKLATLRFVYADGTRESIDLLTPFGRVRHRGRGYVADLGRLEKFLNREIEYPTRRILDGRPSEARFVLRGIEERIRAVAFSPDGKNLASAGEDRDILIWDTATGKLRTVLRDRGPAFSVAFSPDGRLLAVGNRSERFARAGIVRLLEADTGRVRATFEGGSYGFWSPAFSRDGASLAVGRVGGVRIWDLSAGEEKADLKWESKLIRRLSFAPDGRSLVAADATGSVLRWDLSKPTPNPRSGRHEQGVTSVSFSPDGKTFVTASEENDLKVWNRATGIEVAYHREGIGTAWGSDGSCYAAFSADGLGVLTASQQKARLRDPGTLKLIAEIDIPIRDRKDYFMEGMVFSPDGGSVAGFGLHDPGTGMSHEAIVFLWDISSLAKSAARAR